MLSDEEKKEYIEHEILDRLYCLEENDFDKNKVDDGYIEAVLNACKETKNLIEKQSKEIEELKTINQMQKYRIEVIDERELISKDIIKEILGIEENIDNEKLLSLLQTIVDENSRLEDIEDRKVQIEYNNVFNKGVKSVEDKIKAKILECRKILYSFEKELELKANKEKYIHKESMNCLLSQISILQSLLEKE